MRPQILTQFHESHQLRVSQNQAKSTPLSLLAMIVLACQQCQDHLNSNPREPIIQKPKPNRPFQEIAVDLHSYAGRTYFIIVDCFTDWLAIISLDRSITAEQIIMAIRQLFCRTAVLDIMWSDGEPKQNSRDTRDTIS